MKESSIVKQYHNKLSNKFNVKRKNLKKINSFEQLVSFIRNQYINNINKNEKYLLIEKVRLEEKVSYSKNIDVGDVFNNIFMSTLTIFCVVISKIDNTKDLFDIATLLLWFFIGGYFILGIIKMINILKEDKDKAFYRICLTVILDLEKEINLKSENNGVEEIRKFLGINNKKIDSYYL